MTKVLLTGCYDRLHRGHFEIFKFARSFKDSIVLVAMDSDKKVKKDKGEDRPFFSQNDRKFALQSIKYIDHVIIFHNEQQLETLCKIINPDIRLVGSDWKGKMIVGEKFCKEVVYFDRIDGYSTTNILRGIKP